MTYEIATLPNGVKRLILRKMGPIERTNIIVAWKGDVVTISGEYDDSTKAMPGFFWHCTMTQLKSMAETLLYIADSETAQPTTAKEP